MNHHHNHAQSPQKGMDTFNSVICSLKSNPSRAFPTQEDRDMISRMINDKKGFVAIAAQLKVRNWMVVRDVAAEMGLLALTADGTWTAPYSNTAVTLPTQLPKRRKCMHVDCETIFLSEGPHHRMCNEHRRRTGNPFEP